MSLNPLSGYRLLGKLNLTTTKRSLELGIFSLLALVLFGWLFMSIGTLVRPDFDILRVIRHFGTAYDVRLILFLLSLFAILAGMVFLHEALHGLFIWAFSGRRPRFGFKVHPYAALPPETYISRNRGILVSLVPLGIVTVLGIPILFVFPSSWLWIALIFLSFNGAASIGDILVAGWLLRFKHDTLWGADNTSNVVYGP